MLILLGNAGGEDISAEEAGTEDDMEGIEAYMRSEQEKLSAEKAAIMNDQSLVTEEKSRLLDQLKVCMIIVIVRIRINEGMRI